MRPPEHHKDNRVTTGTASPTGCAGCGATAQPASDGLLVEHHHEGCRAGNRSRARRRADLDALRRHTAGHRLMRDLDVTEIADAAAATGRPVLADRRERRRWRVAVTALVDEHGEHLARAFLRDGHLVGALVDSTPLAEAGPR